MKRLTVDQIRSLATAHVSVDERPENISTTQRTMILMFTEFGIACMDLAEQQESDDIQAEYRKQIGETGRSVPQFSDPAV